jgi:phage minor structural protein
MIHILEKQTDNILAVLDEELEEAVHVRNDGLEETFVFSISVTHSKALYVVGRNRVVIPDENNDYREFIIDEIEKDDDELTAYCTSSFLDIKKQKVIKAQELTGQTVKTAGNFILDGTEWEVGQADIGGVRKVTFSFEGGYGNPYEALKIISSTFEREINPRIIIEGNKVIKRVVDLVEKVGEFRGKEVEFAKDLTGLKRTEKIDIVTALFCIGPEKEDGTRITVFVEDKDALQRWGRKGNHLVETYEPDSSNQDMTVSELETLGKTELKKRIDASVEYEISQVDLEYIPGYEHEKVRYGDTLRIKDLHYVPPLYIEARTIGLERDLLNPTEKKYKLGQFIEYTQRDIMAEFDDFKKNLRTKVLRQPTPPKGAFNVLWIDTSKSVEILYTWDGLEWKKATPTQASEIGAETPEGAQEKVDKIKNDIVYKVELLSSNGIAFKNGIIDTEITAIVYKGKENITDTLPKTAFIWTKTDKDGFFDVAWNYDHVGIGKTISVSSYDLFEKANFKCEIDLPDE